MKLYLGCGPSPLHIQHAQVMGNLSDWTFVDLYVHEPHIKNWDCQTLNEVGENSVETIYASHLLEHFSYRLVPEILATWYHKLVPGGQLILNVPDLAWACKQLLKLEQGQLLEGYFNEFDGEHGLLSVFYGAHSHLGEHHGSGFIQSELESQLQEVGFRQVKVRKELEAHDMGCLIAICQK